MTIMKQSMEFSDKRIRLIKGIDAMYSRMYSIYDNIDRIQQRIITLANTIAKLDTVRDARRIQRNNLYIAVDLRELDDYQYGITESEDTIKRLIHDLDNITSDHISYQEKILHQRQASMNDKWLLIDDAKKQRSVKLPIL